jgi:hypothetical protein
MTNPGDSDEWWKQYGGEGVSGEPGNWHSDESGNHAAVPPPPAEPVGYSALPKYPAAPVVPQYQQYPGYPQSGYPQPSVGQYGAPAYPGGYQPYGVAPRPQGTNGMAIASLVVSLIGLVSCFIGIGPIVGLILGVVALNQIKSTGQPGRGIALAGVWVGVAGIVMAIIYWVVVVVTAVSNSS